MSTFLKEVEEQDMKIPRRKALQAEGRTGESVIRQEDSWYFSEIKNRKRDFPGHPVVKTP